MSFNFSVNRKAERTVHTELIPMGAVHGEKGTGCYL